MGPQRPESDGGPYNAQAFLIQQLMGRMATTTLVRVVAVSNAGGIAPVGTVDVHPLVNQIDGYGLATPHGIIHGLPYFRLQGGANAIILDPEVGDIGIAVFCSRDISNVKAGKNEANPGSLRRFDWADGLYIGGVLNGAPTQYVAFTGDDITLVARGSVTITAPTKVTINSPLVETTGAITAAGGPSQVGVTTHTHPANGSPPTPGT